MWLKHGWWPSTLHHQRFPSCGLYKPPTWPLTDCIAACCIQLLLPPKRQPSHCKSNLMPSRDHPWLTAEEEQHVTKWNYMKLPDVASHLWPSWRAIIWSVCHYHRGTLRKWVQLGSRPDSYWPMTRSWLFDIVCWFCIKLIIISYIIIILSYYIKVFIVERCEATGSHESDSHDFGAWCAPKVHTTPPIARQYCLLSAKQKGSERKHVCYVFFSKYVCLGTQRGNVGDVYPSHPIHARPALLSRSFLRSSPKLFPSFTSHPRSSGNPVSLLPAELPPSYFHASHPIHARPALLSCSFLRTCLAPSCGAPPSYFHASHAIQARPANCLAPSCGAFPQAISTLHIPSTLVRQSCLAPSCRAPPKLFPRSTSHPRSSGHSCLAPSCGAPPKLFPRLTSHPCSSGTPVSLLPAELPSSYFLSRSFLRSSPQAISTLHIPSTLVRNSCLTPSCRAPHKLFPRFTSHPYVRPAILSRSFLRSSPQAISTLHIPSTLVWHSCLAPCCDTPKLFPRFTSHPRSSGNPVSQ